MVDSVGGGAFTGVSSDGVALVLLLLNNGGCVGFVSCIVGAEIVAIEELSKRFVVPLLAEATGAIVFKDGGGAIDGATF